MSKLLLCCRSAALIALFVPLVVVAEPSPKDRALAEFFGGCFYEESQEYSRLDLAPAQLRDELESLNKRYTDLNQKFSASYEEFQRDRNQAAHDARTQSVQDEQNEISKRIAEINAEFKAIPGKVIEARFWKAFYAQMLNYDSLAKLQKRYFPQEGRKLSEYQERSIELRDRHAQRMASYLKSFEDNEKKLDELMASVYEEESIQANQSQEAGATPVRIRRPHNEFGPSTRKSAHRWDGGMPAGFGGYYTTLPGSATSAGAGALLEEEDQRFIPPNRHNPDPDAMNYNQDSVKLGARIILLKSVLNNWDDHAATLSKTLTKPNTPNPYSDPAAAYKPSDEMSPDELQSRSEWSVYESEKRAQDQVRSLVGFKERIPQNRDDLQAIIDRKISLWDAVREVEKRQAELYKLKRQSLREVTANDVEARLLPLLMMAGPEKIKAMKCRPFDPLANANELDNAMAVKVVEGLGKTINAATTAQTPACEPVNPYGTPLRVLKERARQDREERRRERMSKGYPY